MSKKSARFIQVLLVFAVLAILGLALAPRPGGETPTPISTARAVRQNLSSFIPSNGKIEPLEPHVIQAQLTTFVEKVSVKEGQKVSRGQLLLTLDPTQLQSELAHTNEQLVAAEDEHRLAIGGGSPEERAQLEADLAKTNAEIARLSREGEAL